MELPTKETLIKELQLQGHVEGTYFLRTYTSPMKINFASKEDSKDNERATMSTIYAMLTKDSPIDYFHANSSSDVVHYFHLGLPIRYYVVTPEGQYSTTVLGPDVLSGQKLQLMVPAGHWKAGEMIETGSVDSKGIKSPDYSLISEALSPEFHYEDWKAACEDDLKNLVSPEHWKSLKHMIKSQL